MAMIKMLAGQPQSFYEHRPCLFAYVTEAEAEAAKNGKKVNAKIVWGMNISDASARACRMENAHPQDLRVLPGLPIMSFDQPFDIDVGALKASRLEIPSYSKVLTDWFLNIIKHSNMAETPDGKQLIQELEGS